MRPGDTIEERFELEQLAGSGGMGEVFRAYDRASDGLVAVKMLRSEGSPDAVRFEREAQALARLSHPAVVRYVAHGKTFSGELYLAMEWLEGEDLRSRLARSGLTMQESVRLATHAAEGLAAAHAQGIVHRDLKPSNLFLTGGEVERVKLLDFGIAHIGEITQLTQTGRLLGTPGYIAPEQARGEHDLDARADVFSLGCVLYECLTGTQAFTGDHLITILAKILCAEPPRVREVCPWVPEAVDVLVAQMLAKGPDGRPGDGAAVARALQALGVPAASPSEVHESQREHAVALTRGEQRALSVVLIGKENAIAGRETRSQTTGQKSKQEGSQTEEHSIENALSRVAKAFGGHMQRIAGGSVIVTMSGTSIATDQAAQAARCALALRKHVGRRAMVLTTGRGKLFGGIPESDAIDRATRVLLARAPFLGHDRASGAVPIAIDEVTAGLLDARFEVVETEAGLELHGERELADGVRTLLGKPTACVGRDREIEMLRQLFAECVEESTAQAVLVTAPAGVGKSRLAYELMRIVRDRGEPVSIWVGRGDTLRAGSAFALLGQALRGACEIREGEVLPVRREKLRARVARQVSASDQERVAEFIGEILGTPFPDTGSMILREARKDAQLMGDQMRRAWEDFLAAECSAQPVLLVLEDLHWGDLPTVRLVGGALGRLKDKPWTVLALARPEVYDKFPMLWAERGLQQIRLKELNRRASERLVRQVLGDEPGPDTLNRLVTQADGNAFYLEELIRAAAERRGEALPETVIAMVQSRLGALDGEARRVLRAASVFGEAFWPGAISSLLGGERGTSKVRETLSVLVDREVLRRRPESRFPEEAEELAFRHALLREGAYAMLTDDDRLLGHRLAGEWLEQHGESDPLVLAEHFERGKESARAGSYYFRAAEQAHMGNASEVTLAHARRALECDMQEPLRTDLLGLLCEVNAWRNDLVAAAPHVEQVMHLASPGSICWIRAAWLKLVVAAQLGRPTELMETLSAFLWANPVSNAVGVFALGCFNGVYILDSQVRFELAERMLRRMHAVVGPVAHREPIARGWLNVTHAFRDSFAREEPWAGLLHAELARTSLAETTQSRHVQVAQLMIGLSCWLLGSFERAETELNSIAMEDEELGMISSYRPFCLASTLADRGAYEQSCLLAQRLVEIGSKRRLPSDEGRGRWALAETLRRMGHLDAAEHEARAALDLLALLPLDHTAVTATLAATRLAQGRPVEALAAAKKALTEYEFMRACAFCRGTFIRLVHAECLHATGDHDGASAAIAAAREHLLHNAGKIGDSDYRTSFIEHVPENARILKLAQEWRATAT